MAVYKTRKGTVRTGSDRKGGGSSKNVQNLASQLEGVAKQAKSLGMNTAKSDAMVAQTRAEGSKAFKGSSFDKGQVDTAPVITPNALKTAPEPPKIPQLTSYDPGNIASWGVDFIKNAAAPEGFTKDANGQITAQTTGTTDPNAGFIKNFADYMGLSQKLNESRTSSEDLFKQAQRESGQLQFQREYNDYAAKIQAIDDRAQAQNLALEAQGRGQTSSFIGGEQARINREAAIESLKYQSLLSAASNNLAAAKEQTSMLFQVRSRDEEARYTNSMNMIKSVYDFANAAQQRALDTIERNKTRAFEEKKFNISLANDWALKAYDSGQSGLASQLMGIDFSKPDSDSQLKSLIGQIRKPVAAKAPTTQEVDGKLYQYDYSTGKWNLAVDAASSTDVAQQAKDLSVVNDIENLLADPYLDKTVGGFFENSQGKMRRNIGGTPEFNTKLKIENIRANLALAARGELKGQGAVSDFEGKLLSRAQTTLDIDQNPADARFEMTQVKGAIRTSMGLTAPVLLTDPATGESQVVEIDSLGITAAIADGLRVEYQ